MEDVYTIKVRTKPDTRNLYPSERRYSASTTSGLAWVHIALSALSFLLGCLAFLSPITNDTSLNDVDGNDTNSTGYDDVSNNNNYILILAPSLLTIFALTAGIASIVASVKWYIDQNITWLFIASIFSTLFSFVAFVMIAVWFITTTGSDELSDVIEKDFILVNKNDVHIINGSHVMVPTDSTYNQDNDNSRLFTKKVLCINILIAAFLEFLWSILSLKISYKGMRNNYKEDTERRGNCVSVVTTIKGNDTRKLPRNGKFLTPNPDLIEHYPSKKIERIFLGQSNNGFYLKNQNNKAKNTDTSSEFYKERMNNFLNRCASLDGISNPEMRTESVQSECVLNTIPEVEINLQDPNPDRNGPNKDRVTPVSWGDTPDHTIYNQNTLNFEKIFNFGATKSQMDGKPVEYDKPGEEISENTQSMIPNA